MQSNGDAELPDVMSSPHSVVNCHASVHAHVGCTYDAAASFTTERALSIA